MNQLDVVGEIPMKQRAMHDNMLATKMAGGTSMLAAITAWLPHIEAALRIGASLVAVCAGIYAILNYREDLRRKRQIYENTKQYGKSDGRGPNPDRATDGMHHNQGD